MLAREQIDRLLDELPDDDLMALARSIEQRRERKNSD